MYLIKLRTVLSNIVLPVVANKLTGATDWIYLLLCIFDVGASLIVGITAAAIGARVEGRPLTSLVLQLGALGGFVQAGGMA
jgi:hypothetical protein